MNSLKFRAWDSLNKKMWQAGQDGESIGDWTFQTYFDPSDCCFKAIIYGEEFLVTNDPYDMYDHEQRNLPIMQFTSLKDKRGTDIYEGDIVFDGIHKADIVSDNGCFYIHYPKLETICSNGRGYLFREINNIEIIGNIYENKDLLEGLRWSEKS